MLSSSKEATATSALGFPTASRERKKLFPASSPRTQAASTIVNEETPGNIKFLRISVPVAVTLIKHTLCKEGNEWKS